MDPTFQSLVPSFRRHLLATNRSTRTVQTYLCALQGLTRYLSARRVAGAIPLLGVRAGPLFRPNGFRPMD